MAIIERTKESDQQVVERARRVVAANGRLRWLMLLYAVLFLGMCGYCTVAGIRKIESLDQLSLGFAYGLAMAVAWMTFGIAGALCLGKFLTGLQGDFRLQEMLVAYHDRLHDLGQLPDAKTGEPISPARSKQPNGLEPIRNPGAPASRR